MHPSNKLSLTSENSASASWRPSLLLVLELLPDEHLMFALRNRRHLLQLAVHIDHGEAGGGGCGGRLPGQLLARHATLSVDYLKQGRGGHRSSFVTSDYK